MKSLFCIIIITTLFLGLGCEKIESPYLENSSQIYVKIHNPKDSIALGDSVLVFFEIPDTIILNGASTLLKTKESCSVPCAYNKVDSNNLGGTISYPQNASVFSYPGVYNNYGSLSLFKEGVRLYSKFYFIPKEKGVFFLECRSTGGALTADNGTLHTKLIYDFDVPDKHLDLMRKAAGSKTALLEPWIQDCAAKGKGLYVFAVK